MGEAVSDEKFVTVGAYGYETHVEIQIGSESASMTLDEALEHAAGIVGAAQNTARFAGLSHEEFNARFQQAMNANAAEYAKQVKVLS